MALTPAMNFFTHTQLNSYTYSTINGTIYFAVVSTLAGDRLAMSHIAPHNLLTCKFTTTSTIDKWECRATKVGQPYGVGIGLLVGSGNVVTGGVEIVFTVPSTALSLGDGEYRLSHYVQLNNIWYGG